MMGELQNIQNTFDTYFSEYKNLAIAIYGIGRNAELILKNVKGYHFSSLIAVDRIGEIVYGKKVVSIEDAIKEAKIILIAAIPTSTSIIYGRIKDIIPSEILVYDIRGHRLNGGEFYKENDYWEKSPKELYELINTHEIISFDIFDTLIMRSTLESRDVFELTQLKLETKGIDIPFAEWRQKSERYCYQQEVSPVIDKIYDQMRKEYELDDVVLYTAQKMELEIETSTVRPREFMKKMFEYALKIGKKVYLTTDMYLRKEQIYQLLEKCGIRDYHELIISCEYNASKENGELYNVLLEKEPQKRILHIGDNYNSDIVEASKRGIDTFWIMNGYAMLASSSISYLIDKVKSFEDKLLLGEMVASLFNNPFSLNNDSGKLKIRDYKALACCILPITLLFYFFIIDNARKYDFLIFPARDGYFLHKLYMTYKTKDMPEACYFYASRSAVSSSAVLDEKDILVLSSKVTEDLNLNLKNFLENQFHIEVLEELDMKNVEALSVFGETGTYREILNYKNVILEKSKRNREKYIQYIQKMEVDGREKIAVIDIVTQGTLIYGLSNILRKEVDLIAMGTSSMPNEYINDMDRVISLFGNVNEKWRDITYSLSDFSELHLFLEMLYGSKEGQFYGFSESGDIIVLENSEYDSSLLENTQNELWVLINNMFSMNMDFGEISNEFSLAALRILYSKYSTMDETLKKKFSFTDPYDGSASERNLMETLS